MTTKCQTMMDYRFGFPILLQNMPMRTVDGHTFVDVNDDALRHAVQAGLLHKPSPLTGSEVAFIRLCLELNKSKFAERCGVTHPAVIKWEKCGDEPTKMGKATEFFIRFMLLELIPSALMNQLIPETKALSEPKEESFTLLREAMTTRSDVPTSGYCGVTITEQSLAFA